ncbi:MAG: DNA polymerase I [Parcubacteria group bacterium Greene0714_21]|nr:MAG: DNA polymerase I [Parcubacteria group bacterium Greene0416_39]TSD03792.1 MAG: DNA polymerase I [Parcubacteria group bacterium Greene0714_21]
MAEKKKRLLVIDANSLIHRAFHALPPLTTAKGEMVNALYGFLLLFFKAVKEFQPDYIAAAFDVKGPTLRHLAFKEYKAKRVKAPDELYSQIPLVKEALKAFGVPSYEKEGFEADDILGTIAKAAPKKQAHPRLETILVSGDMDALQLVDEHTKVYTSRKGLQDTVLYDVDTVKKRFGGLLPSQLTDYKGLRGDPSDNIPGVTGVGEKTAIMLLNAFGSLDNLYEELLKESLPTGDLPKGDKKIKPKLAALLTQYKDQAFMSRDLATIQRVPLDFTMQDLAWKRFDTTGAEGMLKRFEFRTLLQRLPELSGKKRKPQALSQPSLEKIEQFHEQGILSDKVYELEKALIPVVLAMEELGITIDKTYLGSLAKEMQKELIKIESKVHELGEVVFNIASPKQLSEVLFQKLELSSKGLRKTPGGVVSTASDELIKLGHPIVKEVLAHRELSKLLSTYLLPLPHMADTHSRVHSRFDQLGAATGRISSSSPNLQNIPVQGFWGKRVRKGFVAEQGFFLTSFDYSQMELRIACHLAEEEKMEKVFLQGKDIHRMTASEVFGVSEPEVSDEMRTRAKTLNFGVLYGMGARGFAASAQIPIEEAESFIEQYFLRFPKIRLYIEQTKDFAREKGYVETLFGRKRYIPEINSLAPQLRAQAEREAVNHPIQGSAADIIKIAMVSIAKEFGLQNPKIRLLLQIHDELLFEIADDILEEASVKIKKIMEQAVALKAPLLCEVKTGKNWGELQTQKVEAESH